MLKGYEANFDGVVGPTHNYAGLSFGNLASTRSKQTISNPKQAALEGLAKMKFLHDLGVRQAVLPPQERPHIPTLRRLGFSGTDAQILEKAWKENPSILAAVSSSSSMWAANAATVSPSADTADGKLHFTPANLVTTLHRSIEPPTTARLLKAIFSDERFFVHHDPLPASSHVSDEGAANHTRLSASHGQLGLEIFVYGRSVSGSKVPTPQCFPARQTREASEAVARLHLLNATATVFVHQNPKAIDSGAFHNDVVAVGNENVLFYHEQAFSNSANITAELKRSFESHCHADLEMIEVPSSGVSLEQAISSYLFNSQIVTLPSGMALIAPIECREIPAVHEAIGRILESSKHLKQVHFVDVRQSMSNGGGPACLRLRVVLTEEQIAAVRPGVLFSDELHEKLKRWIERNYRDQIQPGDLADPQLLEESRRALQELTTILQLPSIYEFQH